MLEWAFIFKASGLNPDEHKSIIHSPDLKSVLVGVDSVQTGCEVAKELVDNGCKLVELCGGFGEAGAKEVVKAVSDRVPVAYCIYFPGGEERMQALFS